jgi:hypothetical protein
MQAYKAQSDRDANLKSLWEAMEEVYEFADESKPLGGKGSLLEKQILAILHQTVECSIFIREYTGHGFAGGVLSFWTDNGIDELSRQNYTPNLFGYRSSH